MYMREWNAKNADKVRQRYQVYAANHRDEAKARWAKWRKENPEQQLAYNQAYDKANPKKALARRWKRIARVKAAEGTFQASDIITIFESQNHTCLACKQQKPLTIDHIIPISRGGTNWPSNLQGLCQSCNSRKSDRTWNEFLLEVA
jgi:5-methylcytosine-specific restriction endonuclease McrA